MEGYVKTLLKNYDNQGINESKNKIGFHIESQRFFNPNPSSIQISTNQII